VPKGAPFVAGGVDMGTLRASREIRAAADRIFAAFSDPERLARWWGPAGFTNTFSVCEFRKGGSWSYVMHGPDGRDYPNESVFAEIEAPRKVVIEHVSLPRYRLTITLASAGEGSVVSWLQVFENERTSKTSTASRPRSWVRRQRHEKGRVMGEVTAVNLRAEQERTLGAARRKYGMLARALFLLLDCFYGRQRTLSKFKVLEIIARVPYQAWEHVAYVAMTHTYSSPGFARRIFEFVRESREQQDNEQWHLLILEEMVQKKGLRENFFLYRIVPQIMAFFYYHVSWLLYVLKPSWSYGLNADFEDHAEHEYMEFVRENPQFETEPFESDFRRDYGEFANVADLFRSIGRDERHHKDQSLNRSDNARFS
jgi:uncharacterized protein YndB with AHSA1/START domain